MFIVTSYPGQELRLIEAPTHISEHFERGGWRLPFIREAAPIEVQLQRPVVHATPVSYAVVSTTPTESSSDDEHKYEEPTAEEIAEMRAATSADASAVDKLLLDTCTHRWQKVAMVVGKNLNRFESEFPQLPFIYMQVRMQELEERGAIEIQGDVMAMRYSEVRLAPQTE